MIMETKNKTKLWIAGGVTLTVIVLLVYILIIRYQIKKYFKNLEGDRIID